MAYFLPFSNMLKFNTYGIYCPQAGIYIDPWKQVDRAIITHAHSDHARFGNKHYLAHHLTVPILKYRLGADINVSGIEYGETININGVKISLHPAGHIPGSAQVRLEYKGEVWVVSGDYKKEDDGLSSPFELLKCHHFVTESTFGMPVYNFPSQDSIYKEINEWWKGNVTDGKNSVIMGYALGKAQRILRHLDFTNGQVFAHGAVININKALVSTGIEIPDVSPITYETPKNTFKGAMIVAPPSAAGSPWLRKFEPYSLGICSGWMQLRGTRRRRGADRGFALSDHAGWNQLNEVIKATGAENIYVTHGYKSLYARWLREQYHLNAVEVDTLYEGEMLEESKIEITEANSSEG